MSSKLYDELYPRLNFLIGIRTNFDEFYNSWWTDKCLNYKGDKLSDFYDIFFSRFVVYNSLYNTIVYLKERLGLLENKTNRNHEVIERGDKEKATTLMAKHFSDSDLDVLFTKSEIIKNVNNLINILESKKFVITHKAGQQVPANDLLLLDKLQHVSRREKILGILELLYNVRCNLFHGTKGFEHDQIELLRPINEIMFQMVNLLYGSYIAMTDNLITNLEIEIKKIENK